MAESHSTPPWGHRSSRSLRSNRSGRSRNSRTSKQQELEEEDSPPERSFEDITRDRNSSLSIPVDSIISQSSTANGGDDDYFVTSPPKRSGLTGSISTLFRRVASRDRPIGGLQRATSKHQISVFSDGNGVNTDDGVAISETDNYRGGDGTDKVRSLDLVSTSAPRAAFHEEEGSSTTRQHQLGRGRTRTRSGQSSKRIYASNTDDDSDASYDSRRGSNSEMLSPTTTQGSEYVESRSESVDEHDPASGLKRYRGFSTSIASLFLDESLVCTSIGCFGLILSNRTEYLLQVRDHIRGVKQSKKNQTADKRSPSKVFSYLLLLTIVLIFLTFVIWGFGNGNALADDNYNGGLYNNDDNAAAAKRQRNDDQHDDDYFKQDQDDQVQANRNNNGDDYYHNYYRNRQDDDIDHDDNAMNAQANNDDWNHRNNNNNGDDDDAAAAGDNEAGNNNDDGNGNDASQQAANNDDNVNDEGAAGEDDYYAAADDDGNSRKLLRIPKEATYSGLNRRTTGIFKLRDCQEHVWEPLAELTKQEGNHETNAGRSLVDTYTDNFDVEYDIPERDLATDVRTAIFLTFLLLLGALGRRRRMRTRFQLVRARAQDDRLHQISHSERCRHLSMKEELEDKAYEVACSHTILGCYPTDPPSDELDDEEGVATWRERTPKHEDFVSRGFMCLMGTCCGSCCKCWFQCLSVCALAQEAREMRLLLPPRYQRIDFITHQPFSEYQKDVNELRRGWMAKKRKKGSFVSHYNALSRLSRYILFTAGGTLFVILATLIFNPKAAFSWPDAVLLLATFVQSFLVLYIVHWLFHKSDLSLDAVVKFFAGGFAIAVPSAVFFEGLQVNIILMSAWTVYEIAHSLIGDAFAAWMASNYRLIWVLGELFNAYIVAAVTEELCKYYTFRSVEHPDLIFLTGLDRKSHDEHAAEGGLTAYPFGAHKVSELNRNKSFDSQRSNDEKLRKMLHSTNTTEEFYEDENDVRTYRQKAAAVTTGMISVAVGLACAENMMYVFLLGGAKGSSTAEHRGDVYEEWIVLLFRSVFPIHALAAALQSINMIRKFVEGSLHNNHRIGVGRIILPAVILHGTFDAILMGINVYIESAWDSYLEENEGRVGEGEPYNPTTVNFAAWLSICVVTLAGFLWYIREHRNQQARLILLEEQGKEMPAYASPMDHTLERMERLMKDKRELEIIV